MIEEGSDTSVAAAVMAGVTTKLAKIGNAGRDLYFDLGYRFLYLGGVETGPVNTIDTGSGAVSVSKDPKVEDIHAHEVRFGLRYDIH